MCVEGREEFQDLHSQDYVPLHPKLDSRRSAPVTSRTCAAFFGGTVPVPLSHAFAVRLEAGGMRNRYHARTALTA